MLYALARPLLFRLAPEPAHRLALWAARYAPSAPANAAAIAITVAGLRFPNPVGLAAGFDKNAVAADDLPRAGFGFVEVGSVTPLPQAGNPRPRLFRLAEDRAVINRMGFNNDGAEAVATRLSRRKADGVVGVNIGANKDSPDRIADYAAMAARMAPLASYLAINVSSPNTPGLRDLQEAGALGALIDAVLAARGTTGPPNGSRSPPVFLKVAPDLTPAQIDAIARVALDRRLGALIVGNTTVSRPPLASRHAGEAGGLSGAPLAPLALERLRDFRRATGGAIALIGVGGIASADDAWARIRAGASLVQLYTAMVYEGPSVARRIVAGIERLMHRDGFATVADAVGSE